MSFIPEKNVHVIKHTILGRRGGLAELLKKIPTPSLKFPFRHPLGLLIQIMGIFVITVITALILFLYNFTIHQHFQIIIFSVSILNQLFRSPYFAALGAYISALHKVAGSCLYLTM